MLTKLTRKCLPKFKKRPSASHKYDYGNVYIFGGSVGYFGAPLLAARAAYRSGSGLVHIIVPDDLFDRFPQPYPEVMIHPYHDVKEIGYLIGKMDAALFGPGLNPYDSTQLEVLKLLIATGKPLVIDASGLAFFKTLLPEIEEGAQLVVTPHIGEAQELLEAEEPAKHLDTLTHKKMTVVLKSHETRIVCRRKAFLANNGNPGMATAGAGDVLSGMILSYLGQGHEPLEAAKIGVYLHQLAGNLARNDVGEDSLIASDIIDKLPHAIKTLK